MQLTHVAILPSPGLGHLIPLFELAKRLVVHHGIHVSFLVINTNEATTAQDQLLRSPTLPPGLEVVDLPLVDVSAITTDDITMLARLCVIAEESLKSLRSVLIGLALGKPNALVIDLFCTQAFQVCNDLSIPTYSFFTPSVTFLAFSLYLPTLDREVEGEFIDLPEPIAIPGCSPVRPGDLVDQVRNRKIDEYKWCLFHLSRLPLAAGIFLNSWEDLEPVSLKTIREHPFYLQIPTPPVYPIGPLIKQDEELTISDKEYLAWLDKQPPDSVLFVAHGSGGTLSSEQLTEMAWGLELSKQRFLWVIRTPRFLEKTQGVGMVVPSWAQQATVVRHPSTGGFLSHCGWNSSLDSVSNGVPMIAWPLYAEQKMNASLLTEEIGVAVKPVKGPGKKVIGREEINRVVRLVMESEEGKVMRHKVKQLGHSASRALETGGSSFDSLACVVKKWKGNQ
ncbi:hypothetical protein Pint_08914 [Pistacia integerrima]|uniref:Uncharacterized protein n=1 Tax=Pistacia integerrima TaxID=434235 RepID=A0ACC0XWJ0_9ROSI|nr:hypothetical protein Pint_08914 [Pistacia integerrima]